MLRLLLLLLALAVPFGLWWYTTGNPAHYLQSGVPDGQLLYVLSKLAGLIAVSLLGLQIILVSLQNWSQSIGWSNRHHRIVGFTTVIAVALHVGLFFAAASMRSDHLALGLLTIRLFQGFYDLMVSVGLVAACIMVAAGVLGYRFHKLPHLRWLRRYHVLLILVTTLLALVHSYSIGSETNSVPVITFYLVLVGTVGWTAARVYLKRASG